MQKIVTDRLRRPAATIRSGWERRARGTRLSREDSSQGLVLQDERAVGLCPSRRGAGRCIRAAQVVEIGGEELAVGRPER